MFLNNKTYTTESVTGGHPDKVCDQISDAILDACVSQDPLSRVAVECLGSHGLLVIGGEITTRAKVDYKAIAATLYKDIGYDDELEIVSHLSEQSPDIAQGVDREGAGDQGMMYGYATNENDSFLPEGYVLTQNLARQLEMVRKNKTVAWLKPDGKTQVTMENGKVATILVSAQHEKGIDAATVRHALIEHVIKPMVNIDLADIEILTNPTGTFVSGGFEADCGVTGRKIMVDSYGGLAPHGGGCFSGKDATKVDRSGAYMARFAAKNLVAKGFGNQIIVSVAYAIGKEEPLMLQAIDEKGTDLSEVLKKNFDFRPRAIIERLALRNPIYQKTATYGHFGIKNVPWEALVDLA